MYQFLHTTHCCSYKMSIESLYVWKSSEESKAKNHFLLPQSIRGLIIGKSGCGKTTLVNNLLLKEGSGSGLKTSKHQDVILRKKSHTLKLSPRGQGLFLSPYSNYASYFPKGHGLFLAPPPYGRGFKKINLKHLRHNHALKTVPFLSALL